MEEGSIVFNKVHSNHVEAFAFGTGIYEVKLFKTDFSSYINGTCSCPAFFKFGPCKHIAATGLSLMQESYQPDEWCDIPAKRLHGTLQLVHKLPAEYLITIIMTCLAYDQEVLDRIQQSLDQIWSDE